jgi:uncharacterized protein
MVIATIIEGAWMAPRRTVIGDRGNPVSESGDGIRDTAAGRDQVLRAGGCAIRSGRAIFWRAALTDLAASDLAAIYPKPTPRVIAKARPSIDLHAKGFIAMSPFCVLATSGADGSVDASPRGGNPGFVHIAGDNLLLMPDRSGNNRIDSFRNIVEGSGLVQLIFFVPGIDETLRVGGRGAVTADPDLLARMVEFGKLPRAALRIEVREAYFHCGKALMRAKLWSHETHVMRASFPSISEVIYDQTSLGEPESQDVVEARYKAQL